jgi:hypothetical protein
MDGRARAAAAKSFMRQLAHCDNFQTSNATE